MINILFFDIDTQQNCMYTDSDAIHFIPRNGDTVYTKNATRYKVTNVSHMYDRGEIVIEVTRRY